jgi:hypothetical protein
VSRKGMTSQRNCDVELDYQTLELPNNHCKTHYLPLLLYNLHTTTLRSHTLTSYQYHDPFYYYFKDPLWNQDAKEEEDQFFSARGNRNRSLTAFLFPPLKQSLLRKASIRWTQALDLSRSKHVPLTLFRASYYPTNNNY